jgi:fructose-1,6-bisphosphatase/inositol monophosphatase family enzyme
MWDWLQLLGIPVALAALAFLLNDAQTRRDQQREDHRSAQQRTTAADAERENTLRAYLAQMSELMLHDDLLQSEPEAAVRNVARTATLTAVRRLDRPRREPRRPLSR